MVCDWSLCWKAGALRKRNAFITLFLGWRMGKVCLLAQLQYILIVRCSLEHKNSCSQLVDQGPSQSRGAGQETFDFVNCPGMPFGEESQHISTNALYSLRFEAALAPALCDLPSAADPFHDRFDETSQQVF